MLRAFLRDLAHHRARVAMTVIAVALGVAATVAAWVVADSVAATLADRAGRDNVAVDIQTTSGSASAATALTTTDQRRLAALPGVRTATGVVVGRAGLVGRDGKLVTGGTLPSRAGTGWDRTGRFALTAGRAPTGPNEVALLDTAARRAGLSAGDTARITLAGGRSWRPTVVGLYDYHTLGVPSATDGGADAVPTAASAPEATPQLFGARYDRIELTARPGTDPVELARAARQVLAQTDAGGPRVITGAELAAAGERAARADATDLRETLLPFAAVALLVGMFIIANTFAMLVAQQTRQLALLRAVGARRRQVRRAVILEAAALGLVGGTVGAAGGIAAGPAAIAVLRPDENIAYQVGPTGVLLGYAVALVVTVLAARAAARRAASTPPVAALRDDPTTTPTRRTAAPAPRSVLGLLLLVVGVAGVALTANPDSATAARVVAIGSALVGVLGMVVLMPPLAGAVLRGLAVLVERCGTATRLGVRNAARDPGRAARTAAAVTVGVGLVCAFATVSTSLAALIGSTVTDTVPAATTVVAPAVSGDKALTAADLAAVRAVPGVTAAFASTDIIATVRYPGGSTRLRTSTLAPEALGRVLTPRITAGHGDLRDGVLVSQNQADMLGLHPGGQLTLDFPDTTPVHVTVAGVYRATELQSAVYVNAAAVPAATRRAITDIYATGTDPVALHRAIGATFRNRPDVLVTDRDGLVRAEVAEQRLAFVVMYAMFGIADLVAVVGIVNTLALSVIERRREIGVLRAVGASRRLVRAVIRRESLVLSLFGGSLGVVLGLLVGAVMQHAMLGQRLWDAAVPTGTVLAVAAAAAVVGVLAAAWPAYRASRTDPLDAINTA